MTTSNFIPLFSYTTTKCYLDINLYTNTNNMTQGQIDILLLLSDAWHWQKEKTIYDNFTVFPMMINKITPSVDTCL